jgi:hypothetical protein
MGWVGAKGLAAVLALAACGQTITITIGPSAAPAAPAAAAPAAAPATPAVPRPAAPPPGWERLFSATPWGFRMTAPGEPVRRGGRAERFELRGGDCDGADCAAGRSRTELRELRPPVGLRPGREVWYGFSLFNAGQGPVARAADPGLVLAQWKTEGEAPPFIRITRLAQGEGNWDTCDPAVCSRAGAPGDDVVLELTDMAQAARWGPAQNGGAVCRLFSMQGARGRWTDVVLSTDFAADGDGHVRVWVNGQLRCNYYGRVVATTAGWGRGPTQRHGLFAPSLARVAARGVSVPPMVVFFDEFLSGRSRAAVDTRLREAQRQPARD